MKKHPFAHRWALVTGASGGIGLAIATELARLGLNVALTARSRDKLEALAADLRVRFGVETLVIPVDLASPTGAQDLVAAMGPRNIDVLVNNAGLGYWGAFSAMPWADCKALIDLDLTALTALTHLVLPGMLARGRGHIMNIASVAAYASIPDFAVYAAVKAYVRNFSEALDAELKGTGVRTIAVCPGGTRSDFSRAAGQKLNRLGEASLMTAEAVARIGVRKMFAGRRTVVTGFPNAAVTWCLRLLPRAWQPWLMRRLLGAGVDKERVVPAAP
jgi:hypothetical protein